MPTTASHYTTQACQADIEHTGVGILPANAARLYQLTSTFAVGLCLAGLAQAQTCIDARDGHLDFNLPTALVTPQLQHNGLPFPANAADSAEIWLAQDGILQVKLGDTHVASSPVRIVADHYDVVWRDLTPDNPTLPRNGYAVLMRDLPLLQDGNLTVNVSSVLVSGQVTLNGAAFPASQYERAELVATAAVGGGSVLLGDTTQGGFVKRLITGDYAIVYRHVTGSSVVPVNENAVLDTVSVAPAMAALELDVAAHATSGSFLFDGVLAPSSAYLRGDIVLKRTQANGLVDEVPLGDTSDQTHNAIVIDGTYSVNYRHMAGGVVVPLNTEAQIIGRQSLNGATFDVDVNTSNYAIAVQINGGAAPASPLETGVISIIDNTTGAETELGETQEQPFSIRLIPGDYDLIYRRTAGGTAVPANDYKHFDAGHTFADGGMINVPVTINIPMNQTSIDLDLDGQPWSPVDGAATVRLFDADGTMSRLLGSTDNAPWTLNLIPGDYVVNYSHDSGDAVPRNALETLPGSANVDGSDLTLHLHSIDLDPSVTVDGLPFPLAQTANLSLIGNNGLLGLGSSSGNWAPRRALQGVYRALYSYASGASLPRNIAYQRLCVNAAPCLFCSGFETAP